MLSIEEILKISDEMGIEVRDNTDNNHYIWNENGEKIIFSVDMLMDGDEESISSKIDLQISSEYTGVSFTSDYNLVSCKSLYVAKPVNINQSIIDAA